MTLYQVLVNILCLEFLTISAFNLPPVIQPIQYSTTYISSPVVQQTNSLSFSSSFNLATLPLNNKDSNIIDLRKLKKLAEIFERSAGDVYSEINKVQFTSVKDFTKLLQPEGNIKPDVKIEFPNGRALSAHRIVLTSRSDKFRDLLSSSTDSNGVTVLKLDDDVDENIMKELITFMYSNDFDNLSRAVTLEKSGPSLYYAAQKYQVPSLIDLCEAYLVGCVRGSTVLYLKEIANTYDIPRLKATTASYIATYPELVLNVYAHQLLNDGDP